MPIFPPGEKTHTGLLLPSGTVCSAIAPIMAINVAQSVILATTAYRHSQSCRVHAANQTGNFLHGLPIL